MKKAVIAYVPVLHEGYRRFFEKHQDAEIFYILGKDLIALEDYLRKEIRELNPILMVEAIKGLGFKPEVEILEKDKLIKLIQASKANEAIFVLPAEDVCRRVAKEFLSGQEVIFDSVFLRLDKHKTMEEKPVEADQKISQADFDREVIGKLKIEAEKSSDFWRHIGGAIVRDGKIIAVAHNEHLPSQHSPYANGDPRTTLHKGVGIEYSTAIHSEAKLIAEAARDGVSLKGADLYVTIFPCPVCAKQIAFAGIKRLFYAGGYSILDQEKILKSKGVEIIYVESEK
ncbi:MAG: deaminase [Candidatus Paceibacterota bacterium]